MERLNCQIVKMNYYLIFFLKKMSTYKEGFRNFLFEELLIRRFLSIENIVNELKPEYPYI